MRKIALRGLLGQKRSTLLLWSVVTLAFVFLTLSTTLITSLQKTDEEQRIDTYGSWQVLATGCTQQQAQQMAEQARTAAALPMVNVSGADYFSGGNTYYLSVYDPNLAEMGSFQLKEGRWPAAADEIVLEYAQLSALGLSVGDSFTVSSELILPEKQESLDARTRRLNELRDSLVKEAMAAELGEGSVKYLWQEGRTMRWRSDRYPYYFFIWWQDEGNCVWHASLFADEEHPEGQILGLTDLTLEQFELALESYFREITLSDPADRNGLLYCSMTPEDQHYATGITDVIGSGQRNLRVRIKDGTLVTAVPTAFTVCGVMETVSDRWDTGTLPLPGGYITQECYEEIVACQQTVLEKYPYFDPVTYDWMVLAADTDAAALWQRMAEAYNRYPSGNFYTFFFAGPLSQVGFPQYYDWQYGVTFTLGGPQTEALIPAQGWIVPAEDVAVDGYIAGRQIDTGIETAVDVQGVGMEVPLGDIRARIEELMSAEVHFWFDGTLHTVPMADFLAGDFSVNGLVPMSEKPLTEADMIQPTDSTPLRLNRYALEGSGDSQMLLLVTVILFVTTACAVFQIFFSQMRRRLRRIILMKAIGTTAWQIARMLFWEFWYFLLFTLPVGTALGLGGARLAVHLLSQAQGRQVLLEISQPVLAFALTAGVLALAVGMVIPSLMAVGVPLTGRTVRKKPLPPPRKDLRQSFARVTLRGLAANRGRTAGNALLCVFMMLVTTLCLFLGVQFLTPWRNAVQRDGKPEYLLRAPFAMSDRQLTEYLAELEALGVAAEISAVRSTDYGEVLLTDEERNSPLLSASTEDGQPLEQNGITGWPVTLYGGTSQDSLYRQCAAAVTVGAPDAAAFDAGRQVIAAVPLYRETGEGLETSWYAEHDGLYARDTAIQVGDTLSLAAKTRMVDTQKLLFYDRLETCEVTVGAILYYFPEEGVWPFSDGDGYQILCSPRVLGTLLPNAVRTRTDVEARVLRVGFTTGTGATEFYINGAQGLAREEIDTALLIFARRHYMDVEFYHEASDKLLQDAVNNILLTGLLGLTAALLALLIFANTITSELEAERSRIGILQALGVSNGRLLTRQLCIGVCASALALIAANTLLWGGVILYIRQTGAVAGSVLWRYPVALHAAACAALAVLITLQYILPMQRLRRYLPIENIKSRK